MRTSLLGWIALAVGVFVSFAACAGEAYPDERPMTPDYSKLYYLGPNKATSSSPCIGNPVTPECALVTVDACYMWWDQKICDTIGIHLPEPRGPSDTRDRIIYKFLSKRLITESDIPPTFSSKWRAGDTAIFAAFQVCTRFTHCYTATQDWADRKGECPPIDCSASGWKAYDNGKHAPSLTIIREPKDDKWIVIDRISSWDFDEMDNPPAALLKEGLSQMPW